MHVIEGADSFYPIYIQNVKAFKTRKTKRIQRNDH